MAIVVNLKFTSIGADISDPIDVLPNVGTATPSQVTKAQLTASLGIDVTFSDDYVSQITLDPTSGLCFGTQLDVQGNPLSPSSSITVTYTNLGSNPEAENPRLTFVSSSGVTFNPNVSSFVFPTEGQYIALAGSQATASFNATGNPDYKTRIEVSYSVKPSGPWIPLSFSEQTNSTLANNLVFTVDNANNYYVIWKNMDNG